LKQLFDACLNNFELDWILSLTLGDAKSVRQTHEPYQNTLKFELIDTWLSQFNQ